MTTNPPNVEASNVVPQERFAQWKRIICRKCGLRCTAGTSTDTHTYYQCPNCERGRWVTRPTEGPPIIYIDL